MLWLDVRFQVLHLLTCLFFPFLQTSVLRLVPMSSLCRILPSTGTNQTSPGSRVSRWHGVRNWDVSEITGISKDFPYGLC